MANGKNVRKRQQKHKLVCEHKTGAEDTKLQAVVFSVARNRRLPRWLSLPFIIKGCGNDIQGKVMFSFRWSVIAGTDNCALISCTAKDMF